MAQNAMERSRGGVLTLGFDQLAATQQFERGLNGTFRQTRVFRQRAEAGLDGFPFHAHRLGEKMEVDEIRRGLAIVAYNVAHQNVEDIIVDRNGLAEPGHGESKKEKLRIRK